MADAPWMNKWTRSPRQDRRVIEDGKFVELGKVQVPEPPPAEEVTEREQSALELVVEGQKLPSGNEISSTVFEEARHEPAEEQEGSAGANVLPDAQEGSSATGLESSGESADSNPRTSVGAIEEISNPTVSTTEGPSISEASQEELEPLDAIAEHEKGSQTVAEIAQALEPLPGDVLTEEQSDALAEVLRLPEPTEDNDIPF